MVCGSGEIYALVFDCGSYMTKVGWSGDDAPRACFPTTIGYVKSEKCFGSTKPGDCFVGDEAEAKRSILKPLQCPIKEGMIYDFDDFEKICHHSFYNELRCTPEEHMVFVMEAPLAPYRMREKQTELMFETFNVPAFYLGTGSVCSLYASGRTIGISIDMGYETTNAVPIYEGHIVPYAVKKSKIGAKHIDSYLCDLLAKRGYKFETRPEKEIVRNIKETMCSFRELWSKPQEEEILKTYELPDGSNINIGSELYEAPEILFKPSVFGSSKRKELPIYEMTFNSIKACDIDLRKDMYQNIVLNGGNSMFENIVQRFSDEVQKLGPKHARIKVNAPAERKFSPWIGGSIISSLSTMYGMWITKDEYDDFGVAIVHRKCFSAGNCSSRSIVWTPRTHMRFDFAFQSMVIFLLMCNDREESTIYVIPPEVMFIVFSYLDEIDSRNFAKDEEPPKIEYPLIDNTVDDWTIKPPKKEKKKINLKKLFSFGSESIDDSDDDLF